MEFTEELKSPGRRRFRGRSEAPGDSPEIGEEIRTNGEDECENRTGIFFTCRTMVSLRLSDDENHCRKSCGFHLTRSKWDPYPWVGYVEPGSVADLSGLRAGDCLLEIDGVDVVGLRVKEIASLIKKDPAATINLQVWRNSEEDHLKTSEEGIALSGPLPTLARKLAKALSGAVRALECPVCLETVTSPVSQCVHGHILCVGCRTKTPRCPVCRVRLGQGRCLLADEVQRNIREAFEDSRIGSAAVNSSNNCSLREKLFGKAGRKIENGATTRDSNVPASSTKTRIGISLARLLLGGFNKAVSADNLSVTNLGESSNFHGSESTSAAYRRLGELSHSDRTKSASTGELSRNEDSLQRLTEGQVFKSSLGHLSVPQTPTWGGSIESMTTNSFLCPLARKNHCREPCNYENYIEHLGRNHLCTQVHFWGPNATIPIPLPFGAQSMYILHNQGELFFFQYEDEAAWLVGTGGKGEWILHGWSLDGTEVKLRRPVVRIEDLKPSIEHLAPIPKALGISGVNVELVQPQSEGLEV